MTTTIHIPEDLSKFLEKRSKELHVSRNKLICMILRKEIKEEWPDSFKKVKTPPSKSLLSGINEMISIVKTNRKNKKSVVL